MSISSRVTRMSLKTVLWLLVIRLVLVLVLGVVLVVNGRQRRKEKKKGIGSEEIVGLGREETTLQSSPVRVVTASRLGSSAD